MQDAIEIRSGVLDAITTHARREAPNECCGLLVGTNARIEESVSTENLARSPTRYEVDPRRHVELNRRLRGTAQAVIGAYHSHTHSDAVPSPTDIAEAFYPDFVYVIVSLADPALPSIRGFRIRDGDVRAVRLISVP